MRVSIVILESLMILSVIDNYMITYLRLSLFKAMDYVATDGAKPGVVSMSLGGGKTPTVDLAARRLKAAGFTISVAAGNSDADACDFSPAGSPDVSNLRKLEK